MTEESFSYFYCFTKKKNITPLTRVHNMLLLYAYYIARGISDFLQTFRIIPNRETPKN